MRFTWEELKKAQGRGKGRKITHIKFDFSWKPNQMNLPIKEPKKPKFKPEFNLADRLKKNANLDKKEYVITLKWLSKHENQQWPLACWLSAKVECERPEDALGNPIRDMQSWAWDKIKKAMQSGGFPEPNIEPSEAKQINPKMFENDAPGYDSNNPFNEMRPE
jgi:hypothetical protein